MSDNPFFQESDLPYKLPPFDRIESAHFKPAFEQGMAEQLAEIDAITTRGEPPTVENTLAPLQRSGQLLERTAMVFFNLSSAHTNEDIEAIRSEMAPLLAAHRDAILLNADLFGRIRALYDGRAELQLDAESLRLIEILHRDFVRAGANLSAEDKERLKAMNAELATLQTRFSQNVLKEVNDVAVVVKDVAELDGLSAGAIEAAAAEARSRGIEEGYVITLQNTSSQPPMASLTHRPLRQRLHETSLSRGSRGGPYDNREIFTRTMRLRAERATLLGYDTHAAYGLADQTARTAEAVNARLAMLAPPAFANAQKELEALRAMAVEDGVGDFASWDWDFYTEKVRAARFDFDASQLRPYLELNSVLERGAFYAANRLYGVTFQERTDLPAYQEDVRIFEVFNADGSALALFLFDPYARPSKRGGAWMSAYVSQSGLVGHKPVVANHLNVPKPPAGQPALLTFDEVTTLFHEFGHALHGMFSDVRYPEFSGTNVPRDFVEFPSQVNEMWAIWPEVLSNYARHYETGEVMPQALLDKVLATQTFNQGFGTLEYLQAALLDQAWHQLTAEEVPDAEGALGFEARALEAAGVRMAEVPPRYRSMYFSHIMGGYSAGYYAYIWSEVLDADTGEWFKAGGGLTREGGDRFRAMVLSRGGAEEAMEMYVAFRGGEPAIEPLLKRRGLDTASAG